MALWTAKEAGEYLKMHPESVRRKARRQELPSVRMGRWWRFRKEALDEWLSQGCPTQREQPSLFDNEARTGD